MISVPPCSGLFGDFAKDRFGLIRIVPVYKEQSRQAQSRLETDIPGSGGRRHLRSLVQEYLGTVRVSACELQVAE